MHRWKHILAASLFAMGAVATVTVAENDLDALCDGPLASWPLLSLPLHLQAAQELRPELYGRQIVALPGSDAEAADQCGQLGAHTAWFYHQLARQLDLTGDCSEDCTSVLVCTETSCGLRECASEDCPLISGCEGGACARMAASADACSASLPEPDSEEPGYEVDPGETDDDEAQNDDETQEDDGTLEFQASGGYAVMAPPESDACREYCSPTNTTDKSEYRNGDCACDTFPRTVTDLDGDGALNEFDSDDDCDHLSDELEGGIVWLDPAKADNPFLMVPSGAPAQVTMHFDSLAWGTDKWEDLGEGNAGIYTPPGTQYPDPYLKMESSYASQSVLTESVPSAFNKANHPWDVGSAGYSWDSGVNGLSVSKAVMPSMPNNYDSTAYKLRESAVSTPRVAVDFELWEDDAGSNDRGDDDLIFDLERLDYLTEYASTDVRPNVLGTAPYKVASDGLADIEVSLTTNISSCALQWASMVMGGSYVVFSSQIADYLECAA